MDSPPEPETVIPATPIVLAVEPHNAPVPHQEYDEAEKAVLAVLLTSRNAVFHVMEALRPEDFSSAARRRVCGAIYDLAGRDVVPNVYTVAAEVGPGLPLESLERLAALPPDKLAKYEQEVLYIADVVKGAARLRRARAIAKQLMADLDQASDPDALLGVVQLSINRLSGVLDDHAEHSASVQVVSQQFEDYNFVGNGFPTGLKWLDRASGGFIPAHVWTLAARYKGRKTSLLRNLVKEACRAGAAFSLFSLENKKIDTYAAFLAMLMAELDEDSRWSYLDILKRGLDTRGQKLLAAARRELDSWRLNIYDATDGISNPRALLVQAGRDRAVGGMDILAVDYLQKLGAGEGQDYFKQVSTAAMMLQDFVVTKSVTGILLAQRNEAAIRDDAESESDSPGIKGGGDAAAAADFLVITQYYERNTPSELIVNLKLARHAQPEAHTHRLHAISGLITGFVK